mgnify:CR=1 FL=1
MVKHNDNNTNTIIQKLYGAPGRFRSCDPRIMSSALSQLSYRGGISSLFRKENQEFPMMFSKHPVVFVGTVLPTNGSCHDCVILYCEYLQHDGLLLPKRKLVPKAGLEPARHKPGDFKSLVSTHSTTRARFGADSRTRTCNLQSRILARYPVVPYPRTGRKGGTRTRKKTRS